MHIFQRFKEIGSLFEAGKNEQAKHLLREMLSHYVALNDETDRLRLRIETLEQIVEPQKNLFFESDFFWLRTDSERIIGPFCPKCMHNQGEMILLDQRDNEYICRYCNTRYDGQQHNTPVSRPKRHARILSFSSENVKKTCI